MQSSAHILTANSTRRFTVDGSDELESRLSATCNRVLEGVTQAVGPARLNALVLAGGYGRGEGGVLRTERGDQPYNDLEFYVFLKGSRLWNQRKFASALADLGDRLSVDAGLHVEFKIDSLARLGRSAISMFSYDLVSRHRCIAGGSGLFLGCEHHLDARQLPVSEATRLLVNRCTGLLLAKERLQGAPLTKEDADFVHRNMAKAGLALGDAVLTAFGLYHWSCRERHQRLRELSPADLPSWLPAVREQHAAGVEFKLHPFRAPPEPSVSQSHSALSQLAQQVWLWLENRRLQSSFRSPGDYALSGIRKSRETAPWRNLLLTVRTFGFAAAFSPLAWRYPRERLLDTLPLLLWEAEAPPRPEALVHAQTRLRTHANDWTGLVQAYKNIWVTYG